MEKAIGPTISVSQSTIYITGTSEDNLSGTAIYRYDPPNSQGEATNVDNISTELFTAPQFELTTSGIWKFTAIDFAGNSDSADTENITLYLCNYCNRKTVQLHYRCPTHFSSQTCSFSQTTCGTLLSQIKCEKTPCYTTTPTGVTQGGSFHCSYCNRYPTTGEIFIYWNSRMCQPSQQRTRSRVSLLPNR